MTKSSYPKYFLILTCKSPDFKDSGVLFTTFQLQQSCCYLFYFLCIFKPALMAFWHFISKMIRRGQEEIMPYQRTVPFISSSQYKASW